MALPAVPVSLKAIQHYVKTAGEHDARDPAVAYYCRLYAVQRGMELDKKSPEGRTFLASLMDVMEQEKKLNGENEAIQNEVVGQAHVENAALQMFLHADNEDRAGNFGKNVVKAFYTAGMLFDVLTTFGDLSEDLEKNRKYAKWKAAYIHRCLKDGQTPVPGPVSEEPVDPDLPRYVSDASGGFIPDAPGGFVPTAPGGFVPTAPGGFVPTASTGFIPSSHIPKGVAPDPAPPTVQPANYNLPQFASTPPVHQNLPPAGITPTSEDYQTAMKLCRYSISAMQYEDAPAAIENLTKALNILTTGHE